MQKTKAPRRAIPPGWLTTEQVAVKLDRSSSSVDKMVAAGRLPVPYQFGNRCVLFNEAEVDAHLAKTDADEAAAAALRKSA